MKRIIGYTRVSTQEQVLDRQVQALERYGVQEEFILRETGSGKDFENRPIYQSLKVGLGKLVEGDELVITSLDRLSRNKQEAIKEIEYLKANRITLRVLDLPTTLTEIEGQGWVLEMINSILIEVLTTIAEQERLTTEKRRDEGIAAMKVDPVTGKKISNRTGRAWGRPVINYPANWEQVYAMWESKEISGVQAMQKLGLKKTKFYELVKKYNEQKSENFSKVKQWGNQ